MYIMLNVQLNVRIMMGPNRKMVSTLIEHGFAKVIGNEKKIQS